MPKITLPLLILIAFALLACGGQPDLPHAGEYQVIEMKKSSRSRDRVTCSIFAPEITTRDEFAQTTMKAALDLQAETGAKVVVVNLEEDPRTVGKGTLLAMAFHAPDGGGFSGDQGWTWDVKAADKRSSEDTLRMTTLWWRNRDRFQIPDGAGSTMTDEAALSKFIGETMGVNPDSVTLAYNSMTEYLKK